MPTLYTYFRSSAAYRVRIALAFKGVDYDSAYINLRDSEQTSSTYQDINPQCLVPSLTDGEMSISQSLAILAYIEQRHPTPALLPADASAQMTVLSIAYHIACDIHPLNNLRVLKYLTETLGVDEQAKNDWYAHWIQTGFAGLEAQLQHSAGSFCVGDTPSWADCCLIPQVYNALRFEVDISPYPTIKRIYEHAMSLPEFIQASPKQQPDAI